MKTTRPAGKAKTAKAKTAPAKATPAFAAIADELCATRDITRGGMFGSVSLRAGGKVFAMDYKGKLVVKLPRTRVDELVGGRVGKPFDPGHGRKMKEWIELAPGKGDWPALTREALAFVGGR